MGLLSERRGGSRANSEAIEVPRVGNECVDAIHCMVCFLSITEPSTLTGFRGRFEMTATIGARRGLDTLVHASFGRFVQATD